MTSTAQRDERIPIDGANRLDLYRILLWHDVGDNVDLQVPGLRPMPQPRLARLAIAMTLILVSAIMGWAHWPSGAWSLMVRAGVGLLGIYLAMIELYRMTRVMADALGSPSDYVYRLMSPGAERDAALVAYLARLDERTVECTAIRFEHELRALTEREKLPAIMTVPILGISSACLANWIAGEPIAIVAKSSPSLIVGMWIVAIFTGYWFLIHQMARSQLIWAAGILRMTLVEAGRAGKASP
jgi:hypothetical protein